MNSKGPKFARFEDWSLESSCSIEQKNSSDNGYQGTKLIPSVSAVLDSINRRFEMNGFEKRKNLRKPPPTVHSINDGPPKRLALGRKILDPQGSFLQKWNKIFFITCMIAILVDPLFLYVPMTDASIKSFKLDGNLLITTSALRTFFDLSYILHIIFQFRTGFIAPSSRVFGRGELVDDPRAIMKRYLSSYFIIDVLSILPLPQVVASFIIPNLNASIPFKGKYLLMYMILIPFAPRVLRIYPLFKEVTRTSGILTETLYRWTVAFYNTFLYMLASHVVGAFWYLFSVERELFGACFAQKFFYCFWWGLRNLSSLGLNAGTSTFAGNIFFFGLTLLSLLIGNIQKSFLSTNVREEEMAIKRRDVEEWMSYRMLPGNLRERIRRYEHYKWQENQGVEEETLIRTFPKDLRRDIKRHVYLAFLKKVPMFEKMDEQLLDAICDRMKLVLYIEKSYIIREGDLVDEMLFIIRGKLATMTTNGGRTGFFKSSVLQAGDLCGEELLTWALDPYSSSILPISSRTVESMSEVEAFILMPDDLKFVASQFRQLHSKQLPHIFRFYSLQWKTWAACLIQAAWRRYCRKKIERSLHEAEERRQVALAKDNGSSSTPSLGATIYASRFEDWNSESSSSTEQKNSSDNGYHGRKLRPSVSAILDSIKRRLENGSEEKKNLRKSLIVNPMSDGPPKRLAPRRKILDPQGPFLQKWNKIFVITSVMAVSMDPLFFYVPVIEDHKCLKLDENLQMIASVLRTFFDLFHILHIIFHFKTGFIAPSSRVFGRGELVDDPWAIMKRYLSSYFIIDVISILPLPQVVVLFIIPNLKTSVPSVAMDLLKYMVLIQYVPRFLRIYPLYEEVTRTSSILIEKALARAAYNLFLYLLASHLVGAFWYLFSVESELRCWRKALKTEAAYDDNKYVSCDYRIPTVTSLLNNSCVVVDPSDITNSTTFNFGIFTNALQSGVVESTTDFPRKFLYCFWWGLRNLCSLGQNLVTTTHVGEIIFAICIATYGLVLFSLFVGNMQKYVQSMTLRVEEMRIKRRDVEQWMSHSMLPENLRDRIRRYQHYKWHENRGVDEETLIRTFPKYLRRDIKRHLCLALLKKVPMFEKMDEQLFDAICDRLKPILYTEKSYIFREGDSVDEMLFIVRGKLATMTTNGGRIGFFNSSVLQAGDFCGEELLTWALDPNSSSYLPISTRTVKSISEVGAFALMPDDLTFVAFQYRQLHSKQVQHTFRFYSLQWKTWAACLIQVAWRRYCRKKIERSLHEAEERRQVALAKDNGSSSTPSLGATIYASRFAANALRNLQQSGEHNSRMTHRLLPLLPQKPSEPDFTSQSHQANCM